MKNDNGLCFRCEYRAKFLEEGHGPRMECQTSESSVMGCYMFKPVKPICVKPRKGDERPLTLNIFSCRVERSEFLPEFVLDSKLYDGNNLLVYWKPKEEE